MMRRWVAVIVVPDTKPKRLHVMLECGHSVVRVFENSMPYQLIECEECTEERLINAQVRIEIESWGFTVEGRKGKAN